MHLKKFTAAWLVSMSFGLGSVALADECEKITEVRVTRIDREHEGFPDEVRVMDNGGNLSIFTHDASGEADLKADIQIATEALLTGRPLCKHVDSNKQSSFYLGHLGAGSDSPRPTPRIWFP